MYENVVEIPQVNIRKVFCEDLLDFSIDQLALLLVGLCTSRGDERIQPGVRVEPAILAFWRHVVGIESILEDVRIIISADPAQSVELEGTFGDIGKEGGEFIGAD